MPPSEAEVQERSLAVVPSGPLARPSHFVPNGWTELVAFCEYVAKSDLVPKAYQGKPANVLVAVQHGMALGLTPLEGPQSIAVINGKPGIYGDAALALVLASGTITDLDEYFEEEPEPDTKKPPRVTAVFTARRVGRAKPVISRFSVEDAVTAGLWGKEGPWTQYWRRMLKFRARGFGLRDGWADVLKGLRTVEELQDIEPEYTRVETPIAMPQAIEGPASTAQPTPSSPPASSAADAPAGQPVGEVSPASPPAGETSSPSSDGLITEHERRTLLAELGHTGRGFKDLKDWCATHEIASTTKIPAARYQEILAWAKTPKEA